MSLKTLLTLGQQVYAGLSELSWRFTELTLGVFFERMGVQVPYFFEDYADVSLAYIVLGAAASLIVSIIVYSLIKWVVDIVL